MASEFSVIFPFAILMLSWMFAVEWPRIVCLTIPVSVAWMHWFLPGTGWIQLFLFMVWVLLIVGTRSVVAFSVDDVKKPYWFLFVHGGIGVAVSSAAVAYVADSRPPELLLLSWLAATIFIGLLASQFTTYVIAPLVVVESTEHAAPLSGYFMRMEGTARHKSWNYSIRFADDPHEYRIGWFLFRWFKKRPAVSFSYVRCRCLFGLSYIRDLAEVPYVLPDYSDDGLETA